jgi:hypothetical protein
MGRLVNTSPISYRFNVDQQISTTSYSLPSTMDTSIPGPIYARIKNIGGFFLTVSASTIIFYYGQPLTGSPQTLTTISPNRTKYFYVNGRYLPSSYVTWTNSDIIVKERGVISVKKQNLIQLKDLEYYIFIGGSNNTISTFLNNSETVFGASGIGTEILVYNSQNNNYDIYLRRTSTSWRDSFNVTVNNLVIQPNSRIIIQRSLTGNTTVQGTNIIQKVRGGRLTLEPSFDLFMEGP